MIPKEIFKKVRRIEITTSRLVTDVFAGVYHSVFKGRGMEFDEVREYQIGDDVRTIDWNVTARTGRAHIKKYVEERELTVMLVVDVSNSCQFGTASELKSKLAAEIAGVLAFSAVRNQDKVGLILFSDRIEKFIAPRKGLSHVLRVIREVLFFKPEGQGTNISLSLQYLSKVMTRRCVGFVISDFIDPHDPAELKKNLSVANKRHDLVAIAISDPKERSMVDCGLIEVVDAETRERTVVDTSDVAIRQCYATTAQQRQDDRKGLFQSCGVDHVEIFTEKPYARELVKFFIKRRKRIHA